MKLLRLAFSVFCALALHQQVSGQTIPNNDFELWTSRTLYAPDSGWFTSNDESIAMHDTLTVWKLPGVSGQAIHIQTAIIGTDTMFAYAVNSNAMGVPYTGQPTAITGYYRYNLPGNDSAIIFVEFYKSGVPIATNSFMIRNTSGTLATFTPFSLPLLPFTMAPDTVLIAAASSNLFSGVGIEPASWLELDQLAFTGTTSPVIVGGSFDSWTSTTTENPNGWISLFGEPSGISRSTTHYWGSYSAKLETQTTSFGTMPAAMVNGMSGTPYTAVNDTITGYYMYSETGGDSASAQAYLQSAGSTVGSANLALHTAATWTYFELPLNASATPDTLLLGFFSGTGAPGMTSTLYVDHLRVKSQSAGVPFTSANSIQAYPNPAVNELFIKMPQGVNSMATMITVYDAAGRNVGQWNFDKAPATTTIPVASLTGGVYVYEVRAGGTAYKGTFVKK